MAETSVRNAVVTGAAGGMGRAIGGSGDTARVIATDRTKAIDNGQTR